jgi:hypothetical protein
MKLSTKCLVAALLLIGAAFTALFCAAMAHNGHHNT